MVILDSGAVSRLSARTTAAASLLRALREEGLWPPVIPSVALAECLRGHAGRDAATNRFLKACDVVEALPVALARRAAFLRGRARTGSAVNAVMVAHAEPGDVILTSDPRDLEALAAHAHRVRIERV